MGNAFRIWAEAWMPWKESSAMEERLRFVARLIEGEAMTDLCREFGVSRKTGYKIFDRYKEEGLNALTDRSRRPVRAANQLPQPVESLIVRLKHDKPHWGARKIRELLVRRLPGEVRAPAISTVHAVLDRHGLVARLGKTRKRAKGTPLSEGNAQRSVVRRLQGRIQARQRPLLLSAHRHRPGLALSADVRGAGIGARRRRIHRLRTAVHGARPAGRHPVRQRRPFRRPQWPLQPLQAFGLVAAPRHRHRAHQAWKPATERPSRAHAPHPQKPKRPVPQA